MILITDNAECAPLMQAMAQAETLFLDTEFVRETTYFPHLCLLQIATDQDDRVFVVDTLEVDTAPLIAALLESPARKVFHAGKQDLEIVYLMSERLPEPLWDTQVMAAFLGYGDQVGMERLAATVLRQPMDKTQQYTDWAQRPLTDRQLTYAAQDVVILKALWERLYPALVESRRVPWVQEETERQLCNPQSYVTQPERAWERLKIRKAEPRVLARLQKLAAWREEQAIRDNRPRGRILADEALMGLAERPRQKDRWLKGVREEWARELSALVDHKTNPDGDGFIDTTRKLTLNASQELALEAMKLTLKIVARDEKIAAPLLAKSDDLAAFIVNPDDAELSFATGWRRDVVYDRLRAFLAGEGSVACDKGQVVLRR